MNDLMAKYKADLHWHLPEKTQQEAVDWLIEHTSREQLAQLFVPFEKARLENTVKVVAAIGYPDNEVAFPGLFELFQDMNWPGALDAIDYFKTLEKSIVIPYIEAGVQQAIVDNDDQWLLFLYDVCNRLSTERADFKSAALFDEMKRIYERDE